jgi:hypothetical protein
MTWGVLASACNAKCRQVKTTANPGAIANLLLTVVAPLASRRCPD